MTEGSPRVQGSPSLARRFWRLSVFNIASNLMVPLAGLVDMALLGHLAEIRHLAGVALGALLFDYVYWSFGFLRMGTTGLTAQAMGREDEPEVQATVWRGVVLALIVASLILLLRGPIETLGFRLLQGSEAVEASGSAYFRARVWGAPATLMNFVFLGWFLGREQAGRALVVSIVGNLANVVLDYLFIVHFGWSAAGAGAATALSQYLMLALALSYAWPELDLRGLRHRAREILSGTELRQSVTLNRDILVRTLALISVFAFFTNIASTMGTLALAATAIVKQVVTLAAFIIDGFAFATESLAGIFDGAGKRTELRRLLRMSMAWSFLTGLLFAAGFVFLPDIYRVLTHHSEVLDLVEELNPWLFPVLALGSLAYALDGYFIGLVRGKILSRAMLASAILGFAPLAWLAWRQQDLHLLWLALALFMLTRVISLLVCVPGTLRDR